MHVRRKPSLPAVLLSALLVPTLLLSGACATFGTRDAKQGLVVEAPDGLPDASRLNVGIRVFERGLPESGEEVPERVYPGIRSAESYYFPCLLRITLQRSKQWGDVFIVPRESGAIELTLRAEILESDGDRFVLDVQAMDARRFVWLEKRYRLETSELDYYEGIKEDPYQRMFNTIANDLAEARDRLAPEDLRAVQHVAALRFAEEFAPEAFSGYVEPDEDGLLRPVRLPAHGDPMYDRVMQARASESMFLDTLDGHYEGLCGRMTQSYLNWRAHAREEAIMYRQARQKKIASYVAIPILLAAIVTGGIASAGTAGAAEAIGILGGIAIAKLYSKAQEFGAEADLHRGALEELDDSFEAEVEPLVVETEGSTHRITGSVEEQYEEWRRLLKALYEAEAGVLTDLDTRIEYPDADAEDASGESPRTDAASDAPISSLGSPPYDSLGEGPEPGGEAAR